MHIERSVKLPAAAGLLSATLFASLCFWVFGLGPATPAADKALAAVDAARLAAVLANDECHRLYGARPFAAEQYPALLEDGQYEWGRPDIAAPGGYSATVTFAADGTLPRVAVYYSTDLF